MEYPIISYVVLVILAVGVVAIFIDGEISGRRWHRQRAERLRDVCRDIEEQKRRENPDG